MYISNDNVDKVLEIIGDNKNISENELINYDTTYKSNIEDNKNGNNNKKIGIFSFIISVIIFLFIGYKMNWFSFMGLNSLGINGCYYNESEKDALCFDGKNAHFKSIEDIKYYVKYYTDDLKIEDKYGNTIISSCKKIKDSKNIICDGLELHKK